MYYSFYLVIIIILGKVYYIIYRMGIVSASIEIPKLNFVVFERRRNLKFGTQFY